jgi:hypothetical protein
LEPVFFFFFMALGFELRAYTLSHSTSLLLWRVFWNRISWTIYLGWLRTTILLSLPSEQPGLQVWATSAPWATPPVFFCEGFSEIGSHELFTWAGFEPQSSCLCLLSSQDYRYEPPVPGLEPLLSSSPTSVYSTVWQPYCISVVSCCFAHHNNYFQHFPTSFIIFSR